jgi:Tfp pilus assembly ATPase PilU
MALSTEVPTIDPFTKLTANEKTKMLREYECYCYQITWFMLRHEEQAMSAAKQILLQLYEHEEWFYMDEASRQAEAKHAALIYSLECRKKSLASSSNRIITK